MKDNDMKQNKLEKTFRDNMKKFRKELILHQRELKGYRPPYNGRQFIIDKLTPIEDVALEVSWLSYDVPGGYSNPSRIVVFPDPDTMIMLEFIDNYDEFVEKYTPKNDPELQELKDKADKAHDVFHKEAEERGTDVLLDDYLDKLNRKREEALEIYKDTKKSKINATIGRLVLSGEIKV